MGLFDTLKSTILRRGTDDPLFRKGVDKLNEVLGERRRSSASERWPLASDPEGIDVFGPLLTDDWWALTFGKIETRDFAPKRVDAVDACGWHFGYGTQLMGIDLDGPDTAGGGARYQNDLWIEAEITPCFNVIELDTRLRVLLDDLDRTRRRVEMPDDVPDNERTVYTGRFRPTGDWCAVTHLTPLVVRVRSDRPDASRQRVEQLMHTLLERLDREAFVTWRARVHERNGTTHDPNQPPWSSGRRTADVGSPNAVAAAVRSPRYRLPSPEQIKAALDAPLTGPPIPLDHEAVARSLGGALEKVRTLALAGTGEGVRVQAQGGRAVDLLLVDAPQAVEAIEAGSLDGAEMHPIAGREGFASFDDDTDGAVRAVFLGAGGARYFVRVRGMKRVEANDPIREVIAQLAP